MEPEEGPGKGRCSRAHTMVDQDPLRRHPPSASLLGRFLRSLSAVYTAGNTASDGSRQDHSQPKFSLVFHPNETEKRAIGPVL